MEEGEGKVEKKQKRERETVVGKEGFLGLDLPCWLCPGSQLLGAIKGWFECQSLNFFLYLM
jgi:hypothetical protein